MKMDIPAPFFKFQRGKRKSNTKKLLLKSYWKLMTYFYLKIQIIQGRKYYNQPSATVVHRVIREIQVTEFWISEFGQFCCQTFLAWKFNLNLAKVIERLNPVYIIV